MALHELLWNSRRGEVGHLLLEQDRLLGLDTLMR